MSQINTISEFLLQAGTDYRIFDMGRAIRPLTSQQFLDIENTLLPAPFPRQQHLWLGITFFNRQISQEHYIWFVKLPLDERGLLNTAARNHFLQIIIDALGQELQNTEEKKGQLPENPYSFVPSQLLLANFNSISRQVLGLGWSNHLSVAQAYLDNPLLVDWQKLPVQGIADLACTHQQKASRTSLIENFEKLAPPFQASLCASLENHVIGQKLSTYFIEHVVQHKNQATDVNNGLRALSQSSAKTKIAPLLAHLLVSPQIISPDLLVLIAARYWEYLEDEALLKTYIDVLSEVEPSLFLSLYPDLVQIPSLRQSMLAVLRWPDKSPSLTALVGQLFTDQAQ